MIFIWCLALMAFHIPGKVSGTYRHRLHGLPRIPLPGHTRKITFVTIMSTYKFSLCRLELVVCRDFIFDSIQGEFILLFTTTIFSKKVRRLPISKVFILLKNFMILLLLLIVHFAALATPCFMIDLLRFIVLKII